MRGLATARPPTPKSLLAQIRELQRDRIADRFSMRQFVRQLQQDREADREANGVADRQLQQDRIADRVSMLQFVNAIGPGGREDAELCGLNTLRNGADLLEAQRLGVFAPMLRVLACSGVLSLNSQLQLPIRPPLDGLAAFRLACALKPSNSSATTKLLKPLDLHSQHLALNVNSPISALSDSAFKEVPIGGSVLVEITFKHFLVISKNEIEQAQESGSPLSKTWSVNARLFDFLFGCNVEDALHRLSPTVINDPALVLFSPTGLGMDDEEYYDDGRPTAYSYQSNT